MRSENALKLLILMYLYSLFPEANQIPNLFVSPPIPRASAHNLIS